METNGRGTGASAIILLCVLWTLGGCHEGGAHTGCDGITCSGNGECVIEDAVPRCRCFEEYQAVELECLEIPGPDGDGDTDADAVEDADVRDAEVDGSGPDADGDDAGPTDPCAALPGEVVLCETFDAAAVDDLSAAGWSEPNPHASWTLARGALVAGPSCQYWGDVCDEGPALLQSASFEVPDAGFTVAYDVLMGASSPSTANRSLISVRNDAITISWSRAGAFAEELDHIAHIAHVAGSNILFICPLCDRGGPRANLDLAWDIGAWYRVEHRYCGPDGYSTRVVRLSDGVVLANERSSQDVTIPFDVTALNVTLASEGPYHAFDNLLVVRGCGD